MRVIGLTGSIGMGKSTVAGHLRARRLAVFDADAEVHRLYSGKAAPLIEAAFPGTVVDGAVDRSRLSKALLAGADGFKKLEAVVHPLVVAAERRFLRAQHKLGAAAAVLEIPLLYETGADARVDVVIVVSTTREEQRRRVLGRKAMSAAMLGQLLSRQLDDDEKRRRADFVVDTSGPVTDTAVRIDQVLALIADHEATAFDRHWK